MIHKFFAKVFLVVAFLNLTSFSSFSADYCGQPIPRDMAHEGYEKAPDNPFADPGQNNGGSNNSQDKQLSGQVVYIPPGTSIPMSLDRPLGSGFSHMGDVAYGRIDGLMFGIPYGSVAELTVMMIEPASRVFGRPGRIQIGANRLILPNGQSVWMRGIVVDRLGENKLKGETGGRRTLKAVGKVALGSGIGAASGAGIAAISKGNAGTGAIAGTVIGVVIGGVWAAFSKGEEITLPTGKAVLLNVTDGAQISY